MSCLIQTAVVRLHDVAVQHTSFSRGPHVDCHEQETDICGFVEAVDSTAVYSIF